MEQQSYRGVEWTITAREDGTVAPENVTHAILLDIRENLRSVRSMLIFFTVLGVIGCIASFLAFLVSLSK